MAGIRIEAESLSLAGYFQETGAFASGGKYIGLFSPSGSSSTGTATFTIGNTLEGFQDGIFDIVVGYFDETDGTSEVTVNVNGNQVGNTIVFNNPGTNAPSPGANRFFTSTITGVTLQQGGTIQLTGIKNDTEFARVDYIELVRTGDLPDTTAPVVTVNTLETNDTTPALTGTVNDPTATIQVTVAGTTYDAVNNGNGTWTLADNTITTPLAVGTYNVSVTATDASDNSGTDSSTNELTVTAAPVTPPPVTPPPVQTGTPLPDIEFNFNEGNRGVQQGGDSRNNVIRGGTNNDVLQGLAGNDRLFGNAGNDRLIGGPGNDRLIGGPGNDQLIGGAGDDVALGQGGNDRLVGNAGNDTLRGGGGRDLLKGGTGDDTLTGGGGDDIIVGGLGADTLTGNGGRDTFGFNSLADSGDTITDFDTAADLLDLRNLFAAPEFGTGNAASKFTQFVQLVQVGANTEVRIDADGIGTGTAFNTLVALSNTQANTVTAANFVI